MDWGVVSGKQGGAGFWALEQSSRSYHSSFCLWEVSFSTSSYHIFRYFLQVFTAVLLPSIRLYMCVLPFFSFSLSDF